MAYWDIIADVCNSYDFDCYVEADGDNPGEQVLQIIDYGNEGAIAEAIENALIEAGVDTTGVTDIIDFATDGNYVYDDAFICDSCYKLYRNSDYYVNYFIDDGAIFCEDCVNSDSNLRDAYVATLINEPTRANTLLTEDILEDMGFYRGDSYAHGWYGRADSPTEILDSILEHYPEAEVVFSIVQDNNPFQTRFRTFIRYNDDEFEDDI